MEQKGFTLIEIISIVAILAVILLVSFPVYNGIIKENNTKRYDDYVETLCQAAQYYILHNNAAALNQNNVCINLQTLKEADLIRSDLIKKKKKKATNMNHSIVATKQTSGVYKCTLANHSCS